MRNCLPCPAMTAGWGGADSGPLELVDRSVTRRVRDVKKTGDVAVGSDTTMWPAAEPSVNNDGCPFG